MNYAATVRRLANLTVSLYRPGNTTINGYGVASIAAGTTTSGIKVVFLSPAKTLDLRKVGLGDVKHKSATVTASVMLQSKDILTLSNGDTYEVQGVTVTDSFNFWTAVVLRRDV